MGPTVGDCVFNAFQLRLMVSSAPIFILYTHKASSIHEHVLSCHINIQHI